MKALLGIAAAVVLITSPAHSRDRDALTIAGGVVCFHPGHLPEAVVAANRQDHAWLREMGCVRIRENIPVILIDRYASLADPWQVRMEYEPGKSATVWGYSASFKSKAGKPFLPANYGR